MGQEIRGDRPALKQRAGRIRAGGTDAEVTFTPVDRGLTDRIDDACSAKYAGSLPADDLPAPPRGHRNASIRGMAPACGPVW